jgi:23S rRNA pseudouridine1911/1915/1917 synthase
MQSIPIEVLYEDNHIIIINKKVGDIVQGDKTGDVPLKDHVADYLKQKYNKPGNVFVGVVHRLDRPVSGAIIFARTSKALSRLNQMLQKKEIVKTYWAVVKENPLKDENRLIHYVKKNEKANKAMVFEKEVKDSKQAILSYKIIRKTDNYFLLEVNLETGRHHQIRAQLSTIGCPIKGDLKYGFARSNKDGGINLHARSVKFIHPVKKEMIYIEAPLPTDKFWSIFE